jgi:hypothetical protein
MTAKRLAIYSINHGSSSSRKVLPNEMVLSVLFAGCTGVLYGRVVRLGRRV